MDDGKPSYLQGYAGRMRESAFYSIGTFVEVIEVMILAIIAGVVAMQLLPHVPRGVEGSEGLFLEAAGLGAGFGILYVAYRALMKMLFGRSMVVAIPRNPNIDWRLSMRAIGIAGAGIVGGFYLLYNGFRGLPALRDGPNASFAAAVVAAIAIGLLYLGTMKIAIFFLGANRGE